MKLYAGGYLTFYMPGQQAEIEITLAEPVDLAEFLGGLGMPAPEVQLVVINGQIAELHTACIRNRDVVKIFPGIDGG